MRKLNFSKEELRMILSWLVDEKNGKSDIGLHQVYVVYII